MKFTRSSIFCLLSAIALSACVKQKPDTPPDTSNYDPMLPVQATIRDLAAEALVYNNGESRVLGDSTIWGIVIGDDHSGNIYKQIIIQDTSGSGIVIMIDKTTLYGDYPVGRKVYVKLKGLRLTNYNGLPEIIYDFDEEKKSNGIPSSIVGNYIVKASYPNPVQPKVVTMLELYSNTPLYVNTLIKINDVQFMSSSANVPYSDAVRSTTRYIADCPFNAKLGMYNSSYSNFQSAITPSGKGSITGIVSYFNNPQLLLRDTTDIQFTKPRDCP